MAWISMRAFCIALRRGAFLVLAALVTLPFAARAQSVPPGTTLAIGDPQIEFALRLSGEINKLPFKVTWANITGGPNSLQAFRAGALDLGTGADIPPIHAHLTGRPVKVVAIRFRHDPINHPIYQIGVAPGAGINKLSDLKGKRIAYSPGQAQGALVLRILQKLGLSQKDVRLVELPSTTNVYANALQGHLVDAAPLGVVFAKRYLATFGRSGAKVLAHGLRDDPGYLFAPTSVLANPAKAAAVREYVKAWARAIRWIEAHPDLWARAYYVKDQGLDLEDARYTVRSFGIADIPVSWDDATAREQQAIDLIAHETGQKSFPAAELFDRRFEHVAFDAVSGK
jgi:sulfonate transport system substrate-binding protein